MSHGLSDVGVLGPLGGVPTPTSRGVYVWRSVYGILACGPTAEDVTERTTPPKPSDPRVTAALRASAARAVPALASSATRGTYAGLRPGTSDQSSNDYQIFRAHSAWVSVGGIRSTGLTGSLGIGRLVARHCEDVYAEHAAGEAKWDKSGGTSPPPAWHMKRKPRLSMEWTPLPSLAELVAAFTDGGDDVEEGGDQAFVDFRGKFGTHAVTHPLTRHGLRSLAKVRAASGHARL